MKGARSLAPRGRLVVYHGYPPGMEASSSALASAAGEYWVGTGGGAQIDKGGRAWCWLLLRSKTFNGATCTSWLWRFLILNNRG